MPSSTSSSPSEKSTLALTIPHCPWKVTVPTLMPPGVFKGIVVPLVRAKASLSSNTAQSPAPASAVGGCIGSSPSTRTFPEGHFHQNRLLAVDGPPGINPHPEKQPAQRQSVRRGVYAPRWIIGQATLSANMVSRRASTMGEPTSSNRFFYSLKRSFSTLRPDRDRCRLSNACTACCG